jgi:hypothetical protein
MTKRILPIVIGKAGDDPYLKAHEAKNRGEHKKAKDFLFQAAIAIGVPSFWTEDPISDWEINLAKVDHAWGRSQNVDRPKLNRRDRRKNDSKKQLAMIFARGLETGLLEGFSDD